MFIELTVGIPFQVQHQCSPNVQEAKYVVSIYFCTVNITIRLYSFVFTYVFSKIEQFYFAQMDLGTVLSDRFLGFTIR